jgi:tetratricopeptide (TPR) repeat protein
MKKNKKSYLFGALAIILAIIWLYPKAAGQFYLFRGERSIDLVIENVYGADKNAIACTLPPVEDPDDRAPLRTAIADLTKSVDQNPALDHAYILLGRAYCYLGEIDNAVVMYQQYVSQRPNNPLGHLELGFSLERLPDQEQAVAHWKKAGLTAEDFLDKSLASFKKREYHEAMLWNKRASIMQGYHPDDIDKELCDDCVVLESFFTGERWQPCSWCENVEGELQLNNGVLDLSYQNRLEERDRFLFLLRPRIPIDEFDEFILRLRGLPETLFMIEFVIDGERTRPISYQPVSDQWQLIRIPLEGKVLQEILLGIGEPGTLPSNEESRLWIDWIALK